MPRPRTNPDKHRKNVALTIEPDLLMRCRALAAQKGRSLSQLVDQLLREWMQKVGASDSEIENAIEEFIEGHERRIGKKAPMKAGKQIEGFSKAVNVPKSWHSTEQNPGNPVHSMERNPGNPVKRTPRKRSKSKAQ